MTTERLNKYSANHCLRLPSGESRGMNDRVHGIACRCSDKTGKEIGHIFLNTQSIFMQ